VCGAEVKLNEEARPQFIFGNILACLVEDRSDSACVEFLVSRHCKSLALSASCDSSEFYVRTALRMHGETEGSENRKDVVARKSLRLRHRKVPTPLL
jgi:hypothetical protein